MKRWMGIDAIGLTLICLLLTMPHGLKGQTVTAVPKLDLNRVTGTWDEVARLPSKREKNCVDDFLVLMALADKPNRFQVLNSCRTKNGLTDARNGNGRTENKSGDGKMKISYVWPFSTKYWVLATGAEYEWLLIGSPNHKNLWVLSRTPLLQADVLTEIKGKAAAQGFDVDKVMMSPRRGRSGR